MLLLLLLWWCCRECDGWVCVGVGVGEMGEARVCCSNTVYWMSLRSGSWMCEANANADAVHTLLNKHQVVTPLMLEIVYQNLNGGRSFDMTRCRITQGGSAGVTAHHLLYIYVHVYM